MKPRYKKVIVGIIALLLSAMVIPISLVAQDTRTGIKGGLNVSNLYVDDVSDENLRPGFSLGVFTQLPVSEFFVIQPEVNYSTKGARLTYDANFFDAEGEYKFNLNYVDVPILATFKLGESADIQIGPYISYLVGSNISTDGDLGEALADIDRDNFHTFDYGLSAGFGLNFDAISVGVRYNYGLAEIGDETLAEAALKGAKNSVAQLYLALNLLY
uniref:Porin family protein n=1 Tax=Roseihalotalea indica TaxID=2867963 RepID=A0AA49JED4_9BACT|nr:porin family protein [Tunicatimonas sp. TK19036]